MLLFIAYALLSALQREGSALRREVDLSKRSAQRAIPEDPFGSLPPKEMLRFGPAPATEEPPHSVPKKLPDKPEESVKSKKESK